MNPIDSELTKFLLEAITTAERIDVDLIIKEFENQAPLLARRLFEIDSFQPETCAQQTFSALAVADPSTATENVNGNVDAVVHKHQPKFVGFVYPNEDETRDKYSHSNLATGQSMSVVHDCWDLVQSTQEFEESLAAANLTQILASHVAISDSYMGGSNYVPTDICLSTSPAAPTDVHVSVGVAHPPVYAGDCGTSSVDLACHPTAIEVESGMHDTIVLAQNFQPDDLCLSSFTCEREKPLHLAGSSKQMAMVPLDAVHTDLTTDSSGDYVAGISANAEANIPETGPEPKKGTRPRLCDLTSEFSCNSSGFSGFTSASGRKLQLSSSNAIARARTLLFESESDGLRTTVISNPEQTFISDATSEKIVQPVGINNLESTANSISCSVNFNCSISNPEIQQSVDGESLHCGSSDTKTPIFSEPCSSSPVSRSTSVSPPVKIHDFSPQCCDSYFGLNLEGSVHLPNTTATSAFNVFEPPTSINNTSSFMFTSASGRRLATPSVAALVRAKRLCFVETDSPSIPVSSESLQSGLSQITSSNFYFDGVSAPIPSADLVNFHLDNKATENHSIMCTTISSSLTQSHTTPVRNKQVDRFDGNCGNLINDALFFTAEDESLAPSVASLERGPNLVVTDEMLIDEINNSDSHAETGAALSDASGVQSNNSGLFIVSPAQSDIDIISKGSGPVDPSHFVDTARVHEPTDQNVPNMTNPHEPELLSLCDRPAEPNASDFAPTKVLAVDVIVPSTSSIAFSDREPLLVSTEPDPLTSLVNGTQAPLPTHSLEHVDPTIEVKRVELRVKQESIVAEKLSRAGAFSKHQRSGHFTGQFPGHIWRLRCAMKRACLDNLPKIEISHCGYLPAPNSQSPTRDTAFCFPDNVHFPAEVVKWGLRTASKVRWAIDLKVPSGDKMGVIPTSYEIGDSVTLIPDSCGFVGKDELVRAFLALPTVSCHLATPAWVSHHYDQIVWKLGSSAILRQFRMNPIKLDRADAAAQYELPFDYFSPHHVLLRLKYRYDRELEQGERSALRKIIEMDDTPFRRMILCISELIWANAKEPQVLLTDGWYHIHCQPDPALIRLFRSNRLRVGSKLVTAGAELIHLDLVPPPNRSEPAHQANVSESVAQYRHLIGLDGAAPKVALRLHTNSTRPAPWFARLGYSFDQPKSGSGLYPVPLCTIFPDGGLCAAIRVVIQRRFPLQYMETLDANSTLCTAAAMGENLKGMGGSRRHVFRSERAEQAESILHESERRKALDRALESLLPSSNQGVRRKQPTPEQLTALGSDGEALFIAIVNALDPTEAECYLSEPQRDAVRRYKEAAVQSAIADAIPMRKVTPLLRVRVAGLHPRDIALKYVVPLTLWNPSDEMLSTLNEGEPVELYRLQASTTRSADPFAPPHVAIAEPQKSSIRPGQVLSLSSTRSTSVRSLMCSGRSMNTRAFTDVPVAADIVDGALIEQVFQARRPVRVSDLHQLHRQQSGGFGSFIEVDLRCIVVTVHSSTQNSSNLHTKSEPKSGASGLISGGPASLEFDSVYVTDVHHEPEQEFSLAVIKIWGGLQTHHLSGLVQKGRVLHFTDLQLRQRQLPQLVPVLDPELGTNAQTPLTLNYTVASNVTADKTHPQPLHARPGIIKSPSESTSNMNFPGQLERLATAHSSSTIPSRSKHLQVHPLLDGFAFNSHLPSRPSLGPSLSTLLQSGSPNANVTSTDKAVQSVERSLNVESPAVQPHVIPKSTPRTGLSRRSGRRNAVHLSGSASSASPAGSAGTTQIPVVSDKPLTALLHEDKMTVTPEPKAKRRRSTTPLEQAPTPSCSTEPQQDDKVNLSEPSLFDDTFEFPHSPIRDESSACGNNTSTPLGHRKSSQLGPSTPHLADSSSENLDVSIADIVKTRRRSSTCSCVQTNSTPTSSSRPRFTVTP